MTKNVLNTIMTEAKNKIVDTSSLVTATVLNAKLSEATPEFNKLPTGFTATFKQANLVSNMIMN